MIARREKSLLGKAFARLLKYNGFTVKKVKVHESDRSVGGYEFEVTMKNLDMNNLTTIEQQIGYTVTDISPNYDFGMRMLVYTREKGTWDKISKKHVGRILKQSGFPEDIKLGQPIYNEDGSRCGFDVVTNKNNMNVSKLADIQQRGYIINPIHPDYGSVGIDVSFVKTSKTRLGIDNYRLTNGNDDGR